MGVVVILKQVDVKEEGDGDKGVEVYSGAVPMGEPGIKLITAECRTIGHPRSTHA
jgi:hypothetical protein